MPKRKELVHFAIAGGCGFVIDTLVLYMLKGALGPYIARLISFICAVFVTWIINRSLTFKHSPSGLSLAKEFIRYFCMMINGGLANYLTYSLSVFFSPYVARYPVLGVALGSAAGMIINFVQVKLFLFKKKSS